MTDQPTPRAAAQRPAAPDQAGVPADAIGAFESALVAAAKAIPADTADPTVSLTFALGWQTAELFRADLRHRSERRDGDLPGLGLLSDEERREISVDQVQAALTQLTPAILKGGLTVPTDELNAVRTALGNWDNDGQPAVEALHLKVLGTLTAVDFRLGKAYGLGRALANTCRKPTDADAVTDELDPFRVANLLAWLDELSTAPPRPGPDDWTEVDLNATDTHYLQVASDSAAEGPHVICAWIIDNAGRMTAHASEATQSTPAPPAAGHPAGPVGHHNPWWWAPVGFGIWGGLLYLFVFALRRLPMRLGILRKLGGKHPHPQRPAPTPAPAPAAQDPPAAQPTPAHDPPRHNRRPPSQDPVAGATPDPESDPTDPSHVCSPREAAELDARAEEFGVAKLAERLERQRRVRIAEARSEAEIMSLDAAGWQVEQGIFLGGFRVPYCIIGPAGVIALIPTDSWAMSDLHLGEMIASEAGVLIDSECLCAFVSPWSDDPAVAWVDGQGRQAWMMGLSQLKAWLDSLPPRLPEAQLAALRAASEPLRWFLVSQDRGINLDRSHRNFG